MEQRETGDRFSLRLLSSAFVIAVVFIWFIPTMVVGMKGGSMAVSWWAAFIAGVFFGTNLAIVLIIKVARYKRKKRGVSLERIRAWSKKKAPPLALLCFVVGISGVYFIHSMLPMSQTPWHGAIYATFGLIIGGGGLGLLIPTFATLQGERAERREASAGK